VKKSMRTASTYFVQITKGIYPSLTKWILNYSRKGYLDRPRTSTKIIFDPINAKIVESFLIRGWQECILLLVIWDETSPIPAGVSKFGPCIDIRLRGGNKSLGIDGRRATEKFTCGSLTGRPPNPGYQRTQEELVPLEGRDG
jgi:hypothetical protein